LLFFVVVFFCVFNLYLVFVCLLHVIYILCRIGREHPPDAFVVDPSVEAQNGPMALLLEQQQQQQEQQQQQQQQQQLQDATASS
jgi:hypothetical protein